MSAIASCVVDESPNVVEWFISDSFRMQVHRRSESGGWIGKEAKTVLIFHSTPRVRLMNPSIWLQASRGVKDEGDGWRTLLLVSVCVCIWNECCLFLFWDAVGRGEDFGGGFDDSTCVGRGSVAVCGQEKSAVSLSARPVCKNNELKPPSVWVSYVCTHWAVVKSKVVFISPGGLSILFGRPTPRRFHSSFAREIEEAATGRSTNEQGPRQKRKIGRKRNLYFHSEYSRRPVPSAASADAWQVSI